MGQITATCERCGTKRILRPNEVIDHYIGEHPAATAALPDGWVNQNGTTHCPGCWRWVQYERKRT